MKCVCVCVAAAVFLSFKLVVESRRILRGPNVEGGLQNRGFEHIAVCKIQSRKTRLMRTPPCGGKVYIPGTTNTAHHAHTSADSGYSEAEAPSPPALPALGSAVLPATPPLARAHDRSAARSAGVKGVSPAPTKTSSTSSSTCHGKGMVTQETASEDQQHSRPTGNLRLPRAVAAGHNARRRQLTAAT
jgi:hypothetical protein